MKNKVCTRCKKLKDIEEFCLYRTGTNKGKRTSHCHSCMQVYNKRWRDSHRAQETRRTHKYRKDCPWAATYSSIITRCYDKTHKYYKRGIRTFLTLKNLKTLWFRDKGYNMKRPSIHRIDNNGNYNMDNCQYIELSDNSRLGAKGGFVDI